jgi:hypothetical protein
MATTGQSFDPSPESSTVWISTASFDRHAAVKEEDNQGLTANKPFLISLSYTPNRPERARRVCDVRARGPYPEIMDGSVTGQSRPARKSSRLFESVALRSKLLVGSFEQQKV